MPLTRAAREKTTPGGLYQYTVLPFSIHGAPATFQRMMDQILRPHHANANALSRLPGVEPQGPGAWANGGGVWHPAFH